MRHRVLLRVPVLATLAVSAAAHAQYTVSILNPDSASYRVGGASGTLVGGYRIGPPDHAMAYDMASHTTTDIHPGGLWESSNVIGVGGDQLVGYGKIQGITDLHALLWTNRGANVYDLSPAGSIGSELLGSDGSRQVGYSYVSGGQAHATVWSGTAGSAVDLHPTGYFRSAAYGVLGNTQVGYGFKGSPKALLWHGSSTDYVDLTPAGVQEAYALALDANQQVGYTVTGGALNAAVWSGTSASWVNLNPLGAKGSYATAVQNGHQYGYFFGADSLAHAAYWSGTSASVVDLQTYLTGLTYAGSLVNIKSSSVTGVGADGTIYGNVFDYYGNSYAVQWAPAAVPEPGTLAALGLGALALLKRRKKN